MYDVQSEPYQGQKAVYSSITVIRDKRVFGNDYK